MSHLELEKVHFHDFPSPIMTTTMMMMMMMMVTTTTTTMMMMMVVMVVVMVMTMTMIDDVKFLVLDFPLNQKFDFCRT